MFYEHLGQDLWPSSFSLLMRTLPEFVSDAESPLSTPEDSALLIVIYLERHLTGEVDIIPRIQVDGNHVRCVYV